MKANHFLVAIVFLYARGSVGGPSFRALRQIPDSLKISQKESLSGSAERAERVVLKDLQFVESGSGRYRISLPSSRPFYMDRMPQVPMVLREISLPEGKKGTVSLESLEVDESTTPIQIEENPPSHAWHQGGEEKLHFSERRDSRFFPGNFLEYKQSQGILYVTLFPVQLDRTTGHVVILKSAQLTVTFADEDRRLIVKPFRVGSTELILTNKALLAGAQRLKTLHERRWGVSSDIVTVESIDESEIPVDENELPSGYKDPVIADLAASPYDSATQKGYQYLLAKKIIRFLQNRMATVSGTKYVTVVGDATVVPPSYYFAVHTDETQMIGATDQCYGMRAQCSDPQLVVGRLPFATAEEVDRYLDKVESWVAASSDLSGELSLFGGKAFPKESIYVGELSTLSPLSSEKADWRGVKKFFRTKGNYTRENVLDLFRGKWGVPFVYYVDHGKGNLLGVDRETVLSKDILPLEGQGLLPIVLSVSCSNGAFDEALSKEPILEAIRFGRQSIGVSLLKSKAGAIAYLGAGRLAFGSPIYQVDAMGNLISSGNSEFLAILDSVLEKYRQTNKDVRLGDVVLKALRAYNFESGNDPKIDRHRWAYLNFNLLGDPLLPLPRRQWGERSYPIAKSSSAFSGRSEDGFPKLLLNAGTEFNLSLASSVPVGASLYKIIAATNEEPMHEELVAEKSFSEATTIGLKTVTEGSYFLRLENQWGVPRERQVWFTAAKK